MIRTLWLTTLSLLLLAGCSKDEVAPPVTPQAPASTAVTLYFSAAQGLNPGAGGQPAPVRVRLFELRNSAGFSRADYFALAEHAPQTLGSDLLDQEEVLLHPGEQLGITRELNPATRQIGLLVGYRELDQAQWRSVLAVPPRDYQISLDVRAIRADAVQPSTRTAP